MPNSRERERVNGAQKLENKNLLNFSQKMIFFCLLVFVFGLVFGGKAEAATSIYRSVGVGATAPITTGTSNALTISGSTATFASALPDNIGAGDAIQYDSDGNDSIDSVAFIYSRTSSIEYTIKNASGSVPTAVSGDTNWEIYRAYTSLYNAERGNENDSLNNAIEDFDNWDGTGDYTDTDEVGKNITLATGSDEVWNIALYANGSAADTTMVTIDGWTTGADNYIRIYTPVSTSEVGVSQRHGGVWDDTKYKMEVTTSGNSQRAIMAMDQYVRFDGLQISMIVAGAYTSNSAFHVDHSGWDLNNAIRISNNIIKGAYSGGGSGNGINVGGAGANGRLYVWNNIVYGFTNGTGINYRGYAYNNTVYNCTTGINGNAFVAKNNLVQQCTNGYADGSFDNTNSTHNLSDLASDAPGQNPFNSTVVTFENAAGYNFHLSVNDSGAKDNGTDLSADSYIQVTDDIDGETRVGDWDIGADSNNEAPVEPLRTNGSPVDYVTYSSTTVAISLTTDANSTCKYSTTPGTAYASMENTFSTTGGTLHATTVSGLSQGGSYAYYVRCQIDGGGANSTDYTIDFSVGFTYYIRSGASGNNDGTDWTNAWTALPATLSRGSIYYVADGTYSSYTFDDSASETNYIYVKKANASSHGTDTGWQSAYGDGEAQWEPITFSTGYYIFDGVTGGGPSDWTSGFGFKIYSDSTSDNSFVVLGASGSNVTISHTDIGQLTQPNPGCDRAAYSVNGADNVTFSYNYIHHFGDVGFTILDSSGWIMEYNRMDRIDRSGAKDGICGPLGQDNHGSGIEIYDTDNFTIRYNNITNVEGTGWIGFYGGTPDGVYIYGNIFHNNDGFTNGWGNGVIYNTSGGGDVSNLKIYNNTFANLVYSTILGITRDISGNEFKNNIIYNVSGTPAYVGTTKDYNASDEAISGDSNLQTLTSNPFIDSGAGDFTLATALTTGVTLSSPYNTDLAGATRGTDGTWDRGAYEYVQTDFTSPTVTAFVIPVAFNSLAVPISTFTATDDTGVTGYLITESSTAPETDDPAWSGSAPTEYVFATEGAKTLYAWAKDAAGNVSESLSDTVIITLPTYTIGGTISGLSGTVILQNNDGDNLTRTENGSFTFATALHDSDTYNVTVSSQPIGQTCVVTNGSGTISSVNVSNISVTCSDNPSDAKSITAFNFNALTPAVTGTITEGNHTIALTVPYGTNVTALIPTVTITGSSVSPNTGVAQNFTNPVAYTVTAADASTQEYVVTVTVAANNEPPATPDNSDDDEEDYDDLDISKVKYSIIDNNQIKITFKTNNYSKGTARFGIDKNLKQKEKESKNKKKHTIKLKNLIPGTKYYFRISAEDKHDQSERTKIYSVILPKTIAYTPTTSKTPPKPQAAVSNNQNQNTPAPTPQNTNTQNDNNQNTDRNTDIPSSSNIPAPQPEPQKKTFKWYNPFTWF